MKTYPIEDGCPALHCDALEDGEHREADIVERSDALVRPLPLFQARALIIRTNIRPVRC